MKKIFFAILAMAFVLASCGHKSVGSFKVDNFSNGKAGEMLLVMDDNFFTESQLQEVIDSLQQPQPAINQNEPMFDVLHLQGKDFTSKFVRHRNIVHFDFSPKYNSNSIVFDRNAWSNPQVYIKIKGNDVDSCLNLFRIHADTIIDLLYDNDLKRVQYAYNRELEPTIKKTLKEMFGISLCVPMHYFIANKTDDFLWLRFRTTKNDRFIMVYKLPVYELTEENVMAMRDSITKKYIPGAVKNAYPIIARKAGFPIVNPTQIGTKKGMEMRGLWESIGDFMGGPFYSFTFKSPDGQYCITVDGFVYAPQEDKRNYLREVEAIVKSLR
ncbi:MAG: DUF4837 family protein [Bacteroidales bacterium]|nr:DUF4837 family protein [Bacteroidales bacterium]